MDLLPMIVGNRKSKNPTAEPTMRRNSSKAAIHSGNKELGLAREIWQPGFSEVRVLAHKSFLAHKKYSDDNP